MDDLWSVVAAWPWATIITTFLGAGAGTTVFQGLLTLYQDTKRRKTHAAYLAMRLAVDLEHYAAQCSDFVDANVNAPFPPGEEFPDWTIQLPEMRPFTVDDEGWRALDQRLATEALNLPNKIAGSQGKIRSTAEYAEDDLGDVLIVEAADRGLEAWALAARLRSEHHLVSADLSWDFVDYLSKIREKTEAELAARRTRQAQLDSEMFATVTPTPPSSDDAQRDG